MIHTEAVSSSDDPHQLQNSRALM